MSATLKSPVTEQGVFRDVRIEEDLNPQRPGTVYRAIWTGQEVVVRKLDAEVSRDADLLDRVRAEVMRASQLDHPHIARLQWFAAGQGVQVVIREFVRGTDLANYAVRNPLAVEDACDIALQVARGLQAMREQGLVHLAIRPSHIVLEDSGTAKVLGLGFAPLHISRFQTSEAVEDRDGERFDYTAPELARGREDVGVQADIYSLGCLLRWLLTGDSHLRLPLQSDVADTAEGLHRPAGPASGDPLPAGVLEIIEKMTFDRPQDRYADPMQVAEALEPFARESKLRRTAMRARLPGELPGAPGPVQLSEARAPMRDVGAGIVTLLLVALTALAFAYLWSWTTALSDRNMHPVLSGKDETALAALGVTVQPGRNGEWWVDEFPWLLPPVRQSIASSAMTGAFSLDDELLRTGRFDPRWELTNVEKKLGQIALPREVVEITNRFTNVVSGEPAAGSGSAGSYAAIAARFPEEAELPENDRYSAAETHLQAIVMHKRARHQPRPQVDDNQNDYKKAWDEYQKRWEGVEERYKRALQKYAWNEVGLIALCKADYGRMLRDKGEFLQAAQAYRTARETLCHYLDERELTKTGECLYFVADCLWREAAAYRAIGELARAQVLLEDAQQLLGVPRDVWSEAPGLNLPEQLADDNPVGRTFAAYVLERSGWLYMDRWRVREARQCFEFANRLRRADSGEDDSLDFEEQIRIQHNEHGIAMAKRYAGDPDASRNMYHEIESNLGRMVDEHLGLPTSGASSGRLRNPAEYQWRVRMLLDRRINTLERIADCELYRMSHDGVWQGQNAEVWLDEALRLIDESDLLGGSNRTLRAKLYYKKAIVFTMKARDAKTNADSRQGNLVKAEQFRNSADELLQGVRVPPWLEFLQCLCRRFLQYEKHRDDPQTGIGAVKFAEAIRDQYRKLHEKGSLSRDELDMLLLLTTYLPDQVSEENPRLKSQLILHIVRLPFWEHPSEPIDENRPPPIVRYLGSFLGPEPSGLSEVEKTWWGFFRRSEPESRWDKEK